MMNENLTVTLWCTPLNIIKRLVSKKWFAEEDLKRVVQINFSALFLEIVSVTPRYFGAEQSKLKERKYWGWRDCDPDLSLNRLMKTRVINFYLIIVVCGSVYFNTAGEKINPRVAQIISYVKNYFIPTSS